MESENIKNAIIGSIGHHFDGALQQVIQAGGAQGKGPAAIGDAKSSLIDAASKVEACIFDDYEFSARLFKPGVDLGYRYAIVSDGSRTDEWVAALAIDLNELRPHTRKIVDSWYAHYEPGGGVGKTTPRRLVVFVVCAKMVVTMNPFLVIVAETDKGKTALCPFFFSWSVAQPAGGSLVINHIKPDEELLAQASHMLAVVDSSNAAKLLDDHIRGHREGPIH